VEYPPVAGFDDALGVDAAPPGADVVGAATGAACEVVVGVADAVVLGAAAGWEVIW